MVTGQAPITLELRNTPGKNTNNPRWYTHISQVTQFMRPPETYESEIGSQSRMCQVLTGAYVSFFFFSHTSTFQLLDQPWSQDSSLLPPGSWLQLLSRMGFSNPTARRCVIECCLLTLSRFPQVNLYSRKSPPEFVRVCDRGDSNSRN